MINYKDFSKVISIKSFDKNIKDKKTFKENYKGEGSTQFNEYLSTFNISKIQIQDKDLDGISDKVLGYEIKKNYPNEQEHYLDNKSKENCLENKTKNDRFWELNISEKNNNKNELIDDFDINSNENLFINLNKEMIDEIENNKNFNDPNINIKRISDNFIGEKRKLF